MASLGTSMSAELAAIRIEPASTEHLPEISALAGVVWRAHYPGIISPAQIEYMLDQMYDVSELRRQIDCGTVFGLLRRSERLIGFAAHSPISDPHERRLDKLYVHPDHQRHGHGSRLLQHVVEAARTLGCRTLSLTVNKRNTNAIAAYEKNGFVIRESIVTDIGGGFVMDDYVMARAL
jgi:ribosomal protein S18 acetylase RimI-like enzyme